MYNFYNMKTTQCKNSDFTSKPLFTKIIDEQVDSHPLYTNLKSMYETLQRKIIMSMKNNDGNSLKMVELEHLYEEYVISTNKVKGEKIKAVMSYNNLLPKLANLEKITEELKMKLSDVDSIIGRNTSNLSNEIVSHDLKVEGIDNFISRMSNEISKISITKKPSVSNTRRLAFMSNRKMKPLKLTTKPPPGIINSPASTPPSLIKPLNYLNSEQEARRMVDLSEGIEKPYEEYLKNASLGNTHEKIVYTFTDKQRECMNEDIRKGIKRDDIYYTTINDDGTQNETFDVIFNAGLSDEAKLTEEKRPFVTESKYTHVSTIPSNDKNLSIPIIMSKYKPSAPIAKMIKNKPLSKTWNAKQIFTYGWIDPNGKRVRIPNNTNELTDKYINFEDRHNGATILDKDGNPVRVTKENDQDEDYLFDISEYMGEFDPEEETVEEGSLRLEVATRHIFVRYFFDLPLDDEEDELIEKAIECGAVIEKDDKFIITTEPFGRFLIPWDKEPLKVVFIPSPDPVYQEWMDKEGDFVGDMPISSYITDM